MPKSKEAVKTVEESHGLDSFLEPKIDEAKPEDKPTESVSTTDKKEPKEEEKPQSEPEKDEVKDEKKPEDQVKSDKDGKPEPEAKDKPNPFEKRYWDTQAWANRVNQENQKLAKEIDILKKKFDGTYDPEKDDPKIDVVAETATAELSGRLKASLAYAHNKYGQEKLSEGLQKYAQMFGQDQVARQLVLQSDMPVDAMLSLVNDTEKFSQLGTDIDQIRTNVSKEVEERVRKEEREKVTKEFMERLNIKDRDSIGLSEVKGTSKTQDSNVPSGPEPLSEIFRR